jgi:hypothetical protein
MSDLVLGLLVLGGVLFTCVLVYNRMQERAAQRAFGATQPDALLEEAAPRREPVLHKPAVAQASPHPAVDYAIDITLARPAPELLEGWRAIEHRFARRVMLAPGKDERTWRAGLEAARELDKVCADSDIQVALHVIGQGIEPQAGAQPFQVVRREDGVTLVLDVAVTPDLARNYETMARTGRELAALHGARLVDDRGNALDERALAAIGAQLEAVRQTLAGYGIETGSPLALRLFS